MSLRLGLRGGAAAAIACLALLGCVDSNRRPTESAAAAAPPPAKQPAAPPSTTPQPAAAKPPVAPLVQPPLYSYVNLQPGDVPPRVENGGAGHPRAAIGVPPPTSPETCIVSRFWQSTPSDSCPTGRQIVWADRCQGRPVALSHCRKHPISGQVTCWNYDPIRLPSQFPARPSEGMFGCVTRNQDFSGTMRWCHDNNLAWCRDLQRSFR